MATTPMTFNVETTQDDFYNHPLRKEWIDVSYRHPTYRSPDSFPLFLKQEYNINYEYYDYHKLNNLWVLYIYFQSAQDYILWQLHQ